MQKPSDEQVLDYINSISGLRDEWGIPGAKRIALVTFVLMMIMLLVLIIGTIAYFMFVDEKIAGKEVSGLIIVIVLAYAASIARVLQLRAERGELPAYRRALANAFTGNPKEDAEAQEKVDQSFRWEAMRFQNAARMIGLAGMVIIAINTFQIGGTDFARTLIFDAAILSYLAGALWANYAFKTDLLEVTLEERTRATIAWQREHPGEAQRQEAEEMDDDGQKAIAEHSAENDSSED